MRQKFRIGIGGLGEGERDVTKKGIRRAGTQVHGTIRRGVAAARKREGLTAFMRDVKASIGHAKGHGHKIGLSDPSTYAHQTAPAVTIQPGWRPLCSGALVVGTRLDARRGVGWLGRRVGRPVVAGNRSVLPAGREGG